MSPSLKWLFGLSLTLLMNSACAPAAVQYSELETRVLVPLETHSLLLQVDYGEVQLLESTDGRVHVAGQALFLDELEYVVSSTQDQISIRMYSHHSRSSQVPLLVNILLPAGLKVRVETEAASIQAKGFHADLEVSSTSGALALEQMTGQMTLHSNRGNITVRDSSGVVSIVGNYGLLTAQNVRGDVGISTIMGNILFAGSIQGEDNVRLETDHGSVSVNLNTDSDLTLQVRSTSGEVACLLPDVTSSTRTCDGKIDSGNGGLSIRTVSGAVTLQTIP